MKIQIDEIIEILQKIREFSLKELDPDAKTLSTNQILRTMPFFRILDPKKDYYKLEMQVLNEKFNTLENSLSQLIRILLQEKTIVKDLNFSTEKSFFTYFSSKMQLKNIINTILLKELWKCLRTSFLLKPKNRVFLSRDLNINMIFELIKLDFYGFSIPSDNLEDFPLHSSVFDLDYNNFAKFLEELSFSSIDSLDPLGNTPFKLALSLRKFDIANLLITNNADPKLRTYAFASTGFEETVLLKEKPLLREIFLSSQRKKLERWQKTRFLISERLKQVPDFEGQMRWECDSKYLPFLGHIAPKDTCHIKKRGDSLSITLNVIGWKKGALKTGDYMGVFSNSDIYLIDRTYGKILRLNEESKDEEYLQSIIQKTLNNERFSEKETDLKTEKMRFEVLKNLKGKPIIERIETYETFKYEIKGEMTIKKRGFQGQKPILFENKSTFEEYFQKALKQGVFFYKSNGYMVKTYSVISHLLETFRKVEGQALRGNHGTFEQRSKNINATLWMIKDFNLNFQHIIPILDVLEIFSTNIRKFKDFLQTFGYKSYFPIRVSIPLIFSIYASITFSHFRFDPIVIEKPLINHNLDQSMNESDQSLERAHQKYNSLLKIRNKTSTNSDYFNIFEDKDSKNPILFGLNNEENIENIQEDDFLNNSQTPRIILKNFPVLKTMMPKNMIQEIKEINPNLQGIIKNAMDLNKEIAMKTSKIPKNINKNTVIWNEGNELLNPRDVSTSLDRSFQELDLILFEKLRSKSSRNSERENVKFKTKDVDVKLGRK